MDVTDLDDHMLGIAADKQLLLLLHNKPLSKCELQDSYIHRLTVLV